MPAESFGVCPDCGREVTVVAGKVSAHDAFVLHAPRALVRCLGKGMPPVIDTAERIDVLRNEVRRLRGELSATRSRLLSQALTSEATVASIHHLMTKEPASPARDNRLSAVVGHLDCETYMTLRHHCAKSEKQYNALRDGAKERAPALIEAAVRERQNRRDGLRFAESMKEQSR